MSVAAYGLDDEPRCEVCGAAWTFRPLEVTTTVSGVSTVYCGMCDALIQAGMVRPEMVDGRLRYRQWRMGDWIPGELLPEVPRAS